MPTTVLATGLRRMDLSSRSSASRGTRAAALATSLLLASALHAGGMILHVDDSAPAGGDGSHWGSPLGHLQDALAAAAAPGAAVAEIRIAHGIYRPDRSSGVPQGTGALNATFSLLAGVPLRGGYAGFGAADPGVRDVELFPTILSGDLLGNDSPSPQWADNAWHVVTAQTPGGPFELDGVEIRGGNAVQSVQLPDGDAVGGAVRAGSGLLILRKCRLEHNRADRGAAVGVAGGTLLLEACTVDGNAALDVGAAIFVTGGTAYLTGCDFAANRSEEPSVYWGLNSPTIAVDCTFVENLGAAPTNPAVAVVCTGSSQWIDCVFEGNGSALSAGGPGTALLRRSSFIGNVGDSTAVTVNMNDGAAIEGCVFSGNVNIRQSANGGALRLNKAPVAVTDCLFEYNLSSGSGGAMSVDLGAPANPPPPPTVVARCTFRGNAAQQGGAISVINENLVVRACAFVDNGAIAQSANPGIDRDGGAIYLLCQNEAPTIADCLFLENSAAGRGGAVFTNATGPNPASSTILNCTFASNSAATGAGGLQKTGAAGMTLANSILWGNSGAGSGQADQIVATVPLSILHTTVQGLDGSLGGVENNALDPLFVDPLLGPDGIVGSGDEDLRLGAGSPMIDHGVGLSVIACELDLDGAARVAGQALDRGAYEHAAPPASDCDLDALEDGCELLTGGGAALDCNGNGTLDSCESDQSDCNGNFLLDECELASGAADCNGNGVPDSCDIVGGASVDADHDGIPDECNDCDQDGVPDPQAIAEGAPDCDDDGVPDSCQIASGASDCDGDGQLDACQPDCDGNGVADSCDIAAGTWPDLDADGVPDTCQPDCNGNSIPDFVELLFGVAEDCDGNGVPDECDPDCNGNGQPDACDLLEGAADCNRNGQLDVCEIASGSQRDLNGNGVPDVCEGDCDGNGLPDFLDLIFGIQTDCDGNGILDLCDIANGVADCDGNGLPDSCDIAGGEGDCDGDSVLDSCEIAQGAADCNRNAVPDDCDVVSEFVDLSPQLSPIGGTSPQSWTLLSVPPALGPVELRFKAKADLSSVAEQVSISLDGVVVGVVFGPTGTDCPSTPNEETLLISASAFNAAAADGTVTILMAPSTSVSSTQCGASGFIQVSTLYLGGDSEVDGDFDGVPDECQIAGDLSGDGVVGSADLGALLAAWGPCPMQEPCPADLDSDGDVDSADLGLLLGLWQ